MDQPTVRSVLAARTRDDLAALGPDVAALAGGSGIFAEPHPHLTGLVDLQTLGWPALVVTDAGLEIAATCTIAQVAGIPARDGWAAHPLFLRACTALFGSTEIWRVATVGGNICSALPAGPMTALAAALDAEALVWRAASDGSPAHDARMPVAELVTGDRTTALRPGDVLRSIHVPTASLRARTAFRKIALSPIGRSGSVVIGRLDEDGAFTLAVTGATLRPELLRYASLPAAEALADDVRAIGSWFTDAHGAADWRRAVSALLAQEVLAELAGDAAGSGDGPPSGERGTPLAAAATTTAGARAWA
ncbi:FAD-binding molybdopterin dehydrogenase [Clavibacter tessellarius]|uniref:FAD-binding molybdopterin dehydrogenase n=2 Tax=Clavibacter tessellarius TaxID=31965 RepID=A0A225CM58_9MICO|nr:FAD binding domain-containing protein [Clavibacter michiganensis]OQJ63466.1 FAD-binding molybdopterin dehydrogenase [Clavibacter michiganensis subsp. tessellarius]UKF33560.1 FAD-binding molybdopterin dehydrogenase [Clavibacter michiganensis subsp. tessellarius]